VIIYLSLTLVLVNTFLLWGSISYKLSVFRCVQWYSNSQLPEWQSGGNTNHILVRQ